MKRILIPLFVMTGCAVGPNYKPPENTVGEHWVTKGDSSEPVQNDWWESFHDPLLSKYIHEARQHNNDVLTAMSNILQARALRQIEASAFYPQLSALVNATKTYFSKNGPVFSLSTPETSGLPYAVQVPQIQNLFNFLFDASWEIDIFGKTRRKVQAAEAVIGRTIAQKDDILISVFAELARTYMELCAVRERKEIIKENISLLESKSCLIRLQYRLGYVNRIDDESVQAAAFAERAKLPPLESEMYHHIYTISVLIGKPPEALLEELLLYKPLPPLPEKVAVGLRSDLLRRRPDIRKAERELAGATAQIGVAIAQFFPTFSLTGDGGLQSLSIGSLFSPKSLTYAFGGGLNAPIFQGWQYLGNLHARRAEEAAKFTAYAGTVLQALQEAESALMAYNKDLKSLSDTQLETKHQKEATYLVGERNIKGLVSALEVFNAKLQLSGVQLSLLDHELKTRIDLISLYKALGGGWQSS